ncbi:unnamed protein product [Diplocarpon coronariae]
MAWMSLDSKLHFKFHHRNIFAYYKAYKILRCTTFDQLNIRVVELSSSSAFAFEQEFLKTGKKTSPIDANLAQLFRESLEKWHNPRTSIVDGGDFWTDSYGIEIYQGRPSRPRHSSGVPVSRKPSPLLHFSADSRPYQLHLLIMETLHLNT